MFNTEENVIFMTYSNWQTSLQTRDKQTDNTENNNTNHI